MPKLSWALLFWFSLGARWPWPKVPDWPYGRVDDTFATTGRRLLEAHLPTFLSTNASRLLESKLETYLSSSRTSRKWAFPGQTILLAQLTYDWTDMLLVLNNSLYGTGMDARLLIMSMDNESDTFCRNNNFDFFPWHIYARTGLRGDIVRHYPNVSWGTGAKILEKL